MIDEIEKEYLERNSKYRVEKDLLKNFTDSEIKDFIIPLYNEYKNINNDIENNVKERLSKYDDLNELSKYFIETWTNIENWWDRLEELENILKAINTHLYSRLPSTKSYKKEFKKININDLPITQIIWKYIKLSNNLNRNIKCPLHQDNTASFKIYEKTNSFYCFGCHKWWNAINFISYIENLSNKEAFKRLIDLL